MTETNNAELKAKIETWIEEGGNCPRVWIAGELSDLFFNLEHPERDRLFAEGKDFGLREEYEATLADATDACALYQRTFYEVSPEELAVDFMGRV